MEPFIIELEGATQCLKRDILQLIIQLIGCSQDNTVSIKIYNEELVKNLYEICKRKQAELVILHNWDPRGVWARLIERELINYKESTSLNPIFLYSTTP